MPQVSSRSLANRGLDEEPSFYPFRCLSHSESVSRWVGLAGSTRLRQLQEVWRTIFVLLGTPTVMSMTSPLP
jgi:hypothetical protein